MEDKLIDESIEFNISKLPKMLQDMIKELEEYEKNNDSIKYELYFEVVESVAKSFLLNHLITEKDFKIIEKKYGGLYD